MTKEEVTRILGAFTNARPKDQFYMNEREINIAGLVYTVSNEIEMMFRDKVVIQVAAFEISSN